jgi:hypothetical protein
MAAVKANAALSRGHFWWLFLAGLVSGIVGVSGVVACIIGLLFTVQLWYITYTALYFQVIREQLPPAPGQAPAPAA